MFLSRRSPAIVELWQQVVDGSAGLEPVRPVIIGPIPGAIARLASALSPTEPGTTAAEVAPFELHGLPSLQPQRTCQLHLEWAALREAVLLLWERERSSFASPAEPRQVERLIDAFTNDSARACCAARAKMLRALERCSLAALRAPGLDALLPELMSALREASPLIDGGCILLLDQGRLQRRAAFGLEAPARPRPAGPPQAEAGDDAGAGPGVPPAAKGMTATFSAPLRCEGEVLGYARICSSRAEHFPPQDQLLLRTVADRAAAAIALQRWRLEAERHVREARENELRLRGLLEAAAEGILGVDLEGRCTFANPAATTLLGYKTPSHLVGLPIHLLMQSAGDRQAHPSRESLAQSVMLSGEGARAPCEFLWRADHSVFEAEVWAFPVRRNGEIAGAVVGFLDVTERRRAERERESLLEGERLARERAESSADEARREEEKLARCMAILGHDLRSPLQAISLASGQLRRADLSPAHARSVERIERGAARIGQMVADLLDFSRVRAAGLMPLAPGPVDLAELCRSVVDEAAVPGRSFELRLEGNTWGFWDRERLHQALSNLVRNAIEHGAADRPIALEVRDQGEQLILRVHNEGTPIAAELLPVVFEPFRRGRDTPAGLGLGLFIVREAIRSHGGTIEVRSRDGEGTTFSIALPRRCRIPDGERNV